MRVWACSDLHCDYEENLQWCRDLSDEQYRDDVLIVAGDVSDRLDRLEEALCVLEAKCAHLFYCVGNHELWLRGEERERLTSVDKLRQVLALCERLGVRTSPARVGGVWVVPMHSWYHESWDTQPDVPGALKISKILMDYHLCVWPDGLDAEGTGVAELMDKMNDPALADLTDMLRRARRRGGGALEPVVSFSHFLPLQELLPPKPFLRVPNLAKASGSSLLAARVAALAPDVHVFGHTHIARDVVIGGTRYVQQPLDYPRARKRWGLPLREPLLVLEVPGQAQGQAPQPATQAGAAAAAGKQLAALSLE